MTKTPPRVQTLVNLKGDTVIQMSLADAKIILVTVFDKQIADSIIAVYETRDSLNSSTITLLKSEVDLLKDKVGNLNTMISNDTKIMVNKDSEIELLNLTIKGQKDEIRKQKVLKILGFTAAVVLPITVLIILTY